MDAFTAALGGGLDLSALGAMQEMNAADLAEISGFAQTLGLDVQAVAWLTELPPDVRLRITTNFDPSGTKDGNVLGRLKGYARNQVRRAGIELPPSLQGGESLRAQAAAMGQVFGEGAASTSVEGFVSRLGLDASTAQAAAALLMSFPEDLQRSVMGGFDPSGTKDGNVWGRLMGYIRSQWSRRLGLVPEASQFVRSLPEDVQLRVMIEFDINSREGNNSQRLLAFAQGVASRAGTVVDASALATVGASSTRPTKWGVTSVAASQPRTSGVPIAMDVFCSNLGLDTNQMFFLQALPPAVQENVTASFDPTGTKDGNVWGRLLAMVRGVWARSLGVDRATFDAIKAMPEESQMTSMIEYSNLYPAGLAGGLAVGASAASFTAPAGIDAATLAALSSLDPVSLSLLASGAGLGALAGFDAASLGAAGYGAAGYGAAQVGGLGAAGYGSAGLASQPVTSVRGVVTTVAMPQVSRGGGGAEAAATVQQFAAIWGLDQNVVEFMMAIPDQVRDAVVMTFDGSGTKDGNVWGRLLGFVRQTWSRYLGLDAETIEMIKGLPLEAQVICMKDFDPSGTKDGNVAGRLQGFARKAVAVARMGGAVIPSNLDQRFTVANTPRQAALPPPAHDLSKDPAVVAFLERCNLDITAASIFADLPEDILQQAMNEFDPTGTKDGNVLGRLQGYVRHLCRKRGLGDTGAGMGGPDFKRARMG